MSAFDQEITGWHAGAGADRPSLDDQRVARAAFVRDTIGTVDDADQKFRIDPADLGTLAELVDAGEERFALVSRDIGQIPVEPSPTNRGETA